MCQVSILPILPQLTSLIAEFMHNIGATDAGWYRNGNIVHQIFSGLEKVDDIEANLCRLVIRRL